MSSAQRTFAIPTLLAKVGFGLDLWFSMLARLDLRPLPKMSLASASFFLRSRSFSGDIVNRYQPCPAQLSGLRCSPAWIISSNDAAVFLAAMAAINNASYAEDC